ncbi:TetR/AcrR family transcriptional regulator [Chelativorans salis]|uniref:TetR/AcrR family transcriptional regulator n=1 Tax=Chelativorans salis TaxID=2978478 RepID=A0ABT2LSF4_9HYPH|nr:TetR/AcrR family transcriptional regulator [Chelativorans sp. EGI FJ00035]MCT7377468.1 TetR/AcrR family transcriptional regulator [Chelativorans sp. EGI FJ00035]
MEKDEEPQRRSIGARRNPETEKAILQAAHEVLQEAGYAGFSIEAVARRARAGKPTIYRWWPSKGVLLLAVYHLHKRAFTHHDTGDLEKDLLLFLSALFNYWHRTPYADFFRSILAEAQADEATSDAVADYARERCAQIAEVFERARRRGDLVPDAEPLVAAELVLSFAWTRLIQNRLEISDEELRSVVRSLVRGVLKSGAG